MPNGIGILSQIVGLIIQCSTLITVIYAFVRFTQKPTEDLNTRVTKLERWSEKTDERLKEGNVHFKANDESNKVTQSALLTIMDTLGAMDGVPDDVKTEIHNRRKELYDYLTER